MMIFGSSFYVFIVFVLSPRVLPSACTKYYPLESGLFALNFVAFGLYSVFSLDAVVIVASRLSAHVRLAPGASVKRDFRAFLNPLGALILLRVVIIILVVVHSVFMSAFCGRLLCLGMVLFLVLMWYVAFVCLLYGKVISPCSRCHCLTLLVTTFV